MEHPCRGCEAPVLRTGRICPVLRKEIGHFRCGVLRALEPGLAASAMGVFEPEPVMANGSGREVGQRVVHPWTGEGWIFAGSSWEEVPEEWRHEVVYRDWGEGWGWWKREEEEEVAAGFVPWSGR